MGFLKCIETASNMASCWVSIRWFSWVYHPGESWKIIRGGGGEAMYFGDNVFQFNNILEMGPKQIWGDRCSQMFGWVSESKSTINEQSICLGEVNLFLTLSQTQKPERI